TLWNYLDEGKKNITFEANSTLDGYLQTAVNGVGSLAVYSSYWLGDTIVEVNTNGIKVDVSGSDNDQDDSTANEVYLLDSLTGAAKRLQSLTDAANETLAVTSDNYTGMEAVLNEIGKTGMNKTDDDITAVA